MNILIVTGGSVDKEFALKRMKTNAFDYLIAVDKGTEFFIDAGISPDICVGDFDSIAPKKLDRIVRDGKAQIRKYPPEKDWTDTELALNIALEKKTEDNKLYIEILGATGSRMDHVLGSIHLLKNCLKEGVEACIVDPHNRIRLTDHGLKIRKDEQYGRYVSVIPFVEKVTGLYETGFKYPLNDFILKNGCTIGISNEIIEEEANIYFDNGILIIIESVD